MSEVTGPRSTLAVAREALKAGISVIPIKDDGSKAPALGTWKEFQERCPASEEIEAWFQDTALGLAYVCGEVSGNLESIDFDDKDTYSALRTRASEVGLGPLVEKVETGYLDDTPRGVRWLYRCEVIGRNQKLAGRQQRGDEAEPSCKTLIETKGKGGYVIVSPSNGTVHESGKPYLSINGSPATIPIITEDEREDLLSLARSFDETPRSEFPHNTSRSSSTGDRPGDVFDREAEWKDVLQGWTFLYEHGGVSYWRRPRKDTGVSATTNYKGSDLFYPFTTATDLEANKAYNKFAVYTFLNHYGDFSAAAKSLTDNGCGSASSPARIDIDELSDEERTARRNVAWATCRELALAPCILDKFAASLQDRGVVGEQTATQLVFLAMVSRLLHRPVSVVVKGPSSGGKSWVTEKTLDHFPVSAYHALSAMSEHALIYSREPLKHRMLVFYEATGMEGDMQTYLVRTLLSEGRLRYETVDKNLEPRLIEREGPTGAIITTTKVALHPENETRLISVTVDDSSDQTAAVMRAAARRYERGPDDPTYYARWHALQAWLELGDREVVVPYAVDLSDRIPPVATRLRRDFPCLLALIETHALLHQANRARDAHGRIVASPEDYAVVRALVVHLFAEAAGKTVNKTVRDTVGAVSDLLSGSHSGYGTTLDTVSVRQVADALALDVSTVSRRVRKALDGGYLETGRGRPFRLKLGAAIPDDLTILPEVGDLPPQPGSTDVQGVPPAKPGTTSDPCSVAEQTEGEAVRVHIDVDQTSEPDSVPDSGCPPNERARVQGLATPDVAAAPAGHAAEDRL